MKKTTNWLLLFLLSCAWSTTAMAQDITTVSGTVKDSLGNGLAGITFVVKGTKTAGATDNQGNFKVNVHGSNAVLVFTGVGYLAQEVPVGNNAELAIVLKADARSLNEVIVTGFGARTNAGKLSYSVTEIKGSDLTKANNSNFVDAMQGKVAGVFISQGTGGPSSSARIRIRGNSRLNSNTQPLIVIDGILVEPGTTGSDSWGDGQDFGNVIKDLNPDDYESVTVLKGSAASALYGSKALNGVLLITTKKGHARKGIGVSVTHSESYEKAYKGPDFQNIYGGGIKPTFDKDADGNDLVDQSAGPYSNNDGGYSFGPKFDGHMVKDLDGRMVPWVANDPLSIFQTGKYINTNVAAEGGNDVASFRFSYSNLYNTSIMPNNSLNRNSFNLHSTFKLNSSLGLDASVSYSNNKVHNPIIQGGNDNPLFGFAYYMARNAPIDYYEHNYIDPVAGGRKHGATGPNSDPYYLSHMMWNYFENNKVQTENTLLANLDFTGKVTSWLNFLLRANVNAFNSTYEEKDNGTGAGFTGQYYGINQGTYKSTRVQGLLNFSKVFGKDYDLHVSAGGETYRRLAGTIIKANTVGGLTNPGIYTISNSLQPAATSVDYNTYPGKRLDAAYLYGDLTWREMLTFNFSVRNDWSSSLTYNDGHGAYTYAYPSAGLAWVFTELPSFKNSNSILSYGKLRASIGWTGYDADAYTTNNTGYYGLSGQFNVPGYSGNTNQSVYTFNGSTLGNPNLRNELAREIEFGTDIRFFDNRLGFDVTYYKKNAFNQILSLATPSESGVTSRIINSGNIQNQGFEVLISANPIRKKDLNWNMTINYTRNRNKIISLAEGVDKLSLELAFGADEQAYAVPGKDYGTVITGYGYAIYHTKDGSASPANGKRVIGSAPYGSTGYTFLRSQDYDGTTKVLGNIMEKYMFGTNQNLRYKDFFLGVQVDGKIGGLMASATHQYGSNTGAFKNSLFGRDAEHGGIAYTDGAGNPQNDGIIPDGVLNDGIKSSGGVELGGMTYADAVQK
jgi:iron complex outermembrane receptor protein